MDRLVANFERSMAQDSARNEYVFHAKIHQWFAAGLAPGGAYTALPDDGLIGKAAANPPAEVAAK